MSEEFMVPNGEEKFYKKVGQTIRNARQTRNVSPQDLASALQVDVNVIEDYEQANVAIPIYHFLEIAKFLKWPPEFDEIQKNI